MSCERYLPDLYQQELKGLRKAGCSIADIYESGESFYGCYEKVQQEATLYPKNKDK